MEGGEYVWVTDRTGREWVCPKTALKDPASLTAEEREACVLVPA